MATAQQQATATSDAPAAPGLAARLRAGVGRLRELPGWARSKPLLAAGIGAGGLSATVGLVWLVLAVAGGEEAPTVAAALAAYDAQDFVTAREIAGKLNAQAGLPSQQAGGVVFVLGAVAARDAELEFDRARRKQLYHVAGRHLTEARNYGFPPDRRAEGLYLLGQSLHESEQFAESLPALREALEQNPHRAAALYRMLADACIQDDSSQSEQALSYLAQYLAGDALAPRDRDGALLQRARIELQQGKLDAAGASLGQVSDGSSLRSEKLVVEGTLLLSEGDALAQDAQAAPGAAKEKYTAAVQAFRLAQGADTTQNQSTPKAEYLLGIVYRRLGELPAAAKQLDRIAQVAGTQPEGLAALLEAAEVKRELGDHEGAVAAYCRLLKSAGKPESYRNRWLPLEELRRRVQDAYTHYREAGNFQSAVEIARSLWPLLERDKALELEAQAGRGWGDDLLAKAAQSSPKEAALFDEEGRRRLREAGRAYARLARLRRAARSYPDELWNSAEALLAGNDFLRAVVMLDAYLASVSRSRRAQALVALGEAYLALDRPDKALPPLLEGIEQFPSHPDIYRARLLAARVYVEQDKLLDEALAHVPQAKALLDANLHNDTLAPRSVEWRDSLFELGRLQFREGLVQADRARRAGLDGDDPQQVKAALEVLDESHTAFQQAAQSLAEAVQRYPDDVQATEARYLVAEAHRHAANYTQRRGAHAAVEATRMALLQQSVQQFAEAARGYDALLVDLNLRGDRRDLSDVETGMLRNAYFGKADALFQQKKYEQALAAYGAAADRFHDRPEALEALLQLSRCQRELGRLDLARGALERARAAIDRIPPDADYAQSTPYDRAGWQALLDWLIALYAKQQVEAEAT